LKKSKLAQILQQTLNEEGKTDKALTQLAKKINVEAEAPPSNGRAKKTGTPSLRKKLLHAVGLD